MDQPIHRDAGVDAPEHTPVTHTTAMTDAGTGWVPWVPILSLEATHRPQILAHLLSLGEQDRYLRFGHAASDTQIEHYVDQLVFERDELFGIFNRKLELVALAHLAYLDTPSDNAPNTAPKRAAEFGVSVAQGSRGRGYGDRLFDHAALHARNRNVDQLLVHALSENAAMLHIVRNAGARIERDGAESQAWVRLAPRNLASRVEALAKDTAADLDCRIKQATSNADEAS